VPVRSQRFSATGAFLSASGSESGGQFDDIRGIAVGPDCAVFVTDLTAKQLRRIDLDADQAVR
jgi:hypothetical protein